MICLYFCVNKICVKYNLLFSDLSIKIKNAVSRWISIIFFQVIYSFRNNSLLYGLLLGSILEIFLFPLDPINLNHNFLLSICIYYLYKMKTGLLEIRILKKKKIAKLDLDLIQVYFLLAWPLLN